MHLCSTYVASSHCHWPVTRLTRTVYMTGLPDITATVSPLARPYSGVLALLLLWLPGAAGAVFQGVVRPIRRPSRDSSQNMLGRLFWSKPRLRCRPCRRHRKTDSPSPPSFVSTMEATGTTSHTWPCAVCPSRIVARTRLVHTRPSSVQPERLFQRHPRRQ